MEETKCIGGLSDSMWGGQYHQQDRVYSMGQCALALPASIPEGSYKYMEIKLIGQMDNTTDNTFESANRVYGSDGISPTIPTSCGGGHTPKVMECVAMRGRENGQQLEIRPDECVNSITTVQKDNMVLIRQATKQGVIPCEIGGVADLNYPDSKTRRGRVQGNGQICPTLTTENIPSVLEEWTWEIDGEIYLIRIRKLTPRECWRLMGFTDEDFDKAEKTNSNTQLYKQAGNSICIPVLEAVFKQML